MVLPPLQHMWIDYRAEKEMGNVKSRCVAPGLSSQTSLSTAELTESKAPGFQAQEREGLGPLEGQP